MSFSWLLRVVVVLLLPIFLCASPVVTANEKPAAQAWLVTYGPGNVYFERFGHNALWLKNPSSGLDHIFNFGFFDFNQPNFLGRFISGDTLYFAAARNPEVEFAEYIATQRNISLQQLKLNPDQYQRLENYLLDQIQPANRDYRYQYFRNNCSTRVRDALDLVFNGEIQQSLQALPAPITVRQQIHQAAAADPWLYLGMDMAMGPSVDRNQSQWQASFIPEVLARVVSQLPEVLADEVVYYQSDKDHQSGQPLVFLFISSLLLAGLLVLLSKPWQAILKARLVASVWLVICSLAGGGLLWLWLATTHTDAANNWNVLLLNPLYIPAMLWLRSKPHASRRLAMLVVISTVLAAVGALFSGQDLLAPLAFFGLPMLTVSLLLWKAGTQQS